MVLEHQDEYPSQWKAIQSIAERLKVNHESLRIWVCKAESGAGERLGLTTDERAEMKELERDNRERLGESVPSAQAGVVDPLPGLSEDLWKRVIRIPKPCTVTQCITELGSFGDTPGGSKTCSELVGRTGLEPVTPCASSAPGAPTVPHRPPLSWDDAFGG